MILIVGATLSYRVFRLYWRHRDEGEIIPPSVKGEAAVMMEFQFRSRFSTALASAPLPEGRLFERLVTIAIFKESFYAYLSKMVLDAEGIECNICDEYTCLSFGLFSRPQSGYRLRVKESDADKAVDFLLQESLEE
jgi:hypothetical protein